MEPEQVGYLVLYVIFGLIFGALTAWIADKKGYDRLVWFAFGFIIFIVSLPVILLLPPNPNSKKCVYCGEHMDKREMKCPVCRRGQPELHWGRKSSTSNWENAKQAHDPVEKWVKNQEKTDENI